MQNKKPFKEYTVLPNSLIQNEIFGPSDIYRIFVLSLTADKITGKTDTTIDQLADFVGESTFNYQNKYSFTDKLRDSNDVDVNTVLYREDITNCPIKRNYYTLRKPVNSEPFRMIHRELYDVDLKIKIKGYLIRLFSVAVTETLFVGYSQRELAKLLHISPNTIRSYNKELTEKGYILELENGLFLTCPGFRPIEKLTEASKTILAQYHQLLIISIDNYNNSHTDILSIKTITIDDLKKLNLDRSTRIYAYYYINDFSNVKNINGLALFLETGVPYKSLPNKESDDSIIVL
ncbi:MAG: winged helix-turn-helix transcriptional regulator [Paludibacter sp.]|nr:winged helix-turn-helix transcriptional regulator [Paludibacter sp.]